jgi:putative membrane protein
MAGIFYLPRLYVYHAVAKIGSDKSQTFKIMERKLLRGIMYPAMIASVFTGTILVLDQDDWKEFWVLGKIIAGIIMVIYHFILAKWRVDFEKDKNKKSHVFYRFINEVPTILLFFIIYYVKFKPTF